MVAEIERRYKEQNTLHTSYSCGRNDEDAELLSFYNSMQKEPKECMYSKDNYTDEDRKVLCEDCKEKCAYAIAGVISTNAQVKKEPVSEELEKEMNDFFLTMQVQDKEYINEDTFRSIARHFAAWQKQQLMAKAVDATIEEPEPLLWRVLGELEGLFVVENNLHDGDGVKVIIVKED